MRGRKDQNEKVSVGVVMDKSTWPSECIVESGPLVLSADISLLTHKSAK